MRLTTERRGLMGMGRRRPLLMVGIVLVMVLGSAIYFRLWSIDYNFSSEDREFLRRQFDLANRDAMDESAEWRYKYDGEAKKSGLCLKELTQVEKKKMQSLVSYKENQFIDFTVADRLNPQESNCMLVCKFNLEVKENLRIKMNEAVSINKKLAMLRQENIGLLARVESLTQELQAEKLKCSL